MLLYIYTVLTFLQSNELSEHSLTHKQAHEATERVPIQIYEFAEVLLYVTLPLTFINYTDPTIGLVQQSYSVNEVDGTLEVCVGVLVGSLTSNQAVSIRYSSVDNEAACEKTI